MIMIKQEKIFPKMKPIIVFNIMARLSAKIVINWNKSLTYRGGRK